MGDKIAYGIVVLIVSAPWALLAIIAYSTIRGLYRTLKAGSR